MRIIDADNNEVEIKNQYWPLAEDLFVKWNMYPSLNNEIKVLSVHDITSELSAWGIPWRQI
jgi:hypothetical protein